MNISIRERARSVLLLLAMAMLVLSASTPGHAHEAYYARDCAKSGCHLGTSVGGSPQDSPTCAGCHYHGMYSDARHQVINFRGWTDRTSYTAGEMVTVYITGGNKPGWIGARVEDESGLELARATGPTGMGDDGDLGWTSSRLPGPIVLKVRAPYVSGTVRWKVAWYGDIEDPNPPAPTTITHRYLRWHAVPLAPFEITSDDRIGPMVSGVTATPTPTGGVRQIAVTARVSDALSGMSPIRSARVRFMSVIEDVGGSWNPLFARDGRFDSADEIVAGALDIGALPPGPYRADVQGADILGNWGPIGSVTFEGTAPPSGDAQSPSASCGAVVPELVPPGQPVHLRAQIDDTPAGGSPIYGAEAFLTAPGQDGTGLPLRAEDGVLDSPAESMGGDLPTTGLPDGVYPVVIHGLDAAGLWGSYCFASFEVRQSADTTGPSVAAERLSPGPTAGARVALLYATASDELTGNGSITGAEYYVGAAPQAGGGIPMMADDGSYDSPSEGITGAIDVSGWSPGAYVVGVRAKDAAGHWGPVTRLSLSVTMEGPDDAGPKFLWLIATPDHTMGAKKITLKGKIDDSTTGGSRPVLVDFSLNGGSQPGMGTLVRLNGQGTGAHFSAKMDVTHLMEGITYTVFARSMDSRGNWGPVATTAFMVMSHPMGEH